MLPIQNSIIALEYACVVLAILLTGIRYSRRGNARFVRWLIVAGVLVFLSCGLHHFAHAWLPPAWQMGLTDFCAVGSFPLAIFSLIRLQYIWAKIDFFLTAHENYARLLAFTNAAPCGLVELTWEEPYNDFRFIRVNEVAAEIIEPIAVGSGDVAGQLMCESVPGHREAVEKEGGLTTLEIYRRVAFGEAPYESGKREAVLPFNSPQREGTSHFKQVVLRTKPGTVAIGFLDITDKINLIERLRLQTITDQLTGLYSRPYIYQAADNAIAQLKRGAQYCYLRIDLDNFGDINNTYGHQAGDDAIIWAANQIRNCTRQDEAVARMGGDEFAALINGDIATGKRAAERIREQLSHAFMAGGSKQKTSASIGIIELAEGLTSQEVDNQADIAQRQAKERGKNRVVVWGDEDESADQRYRLEQSLLRAVKQQEFILHYQPIVRLEGEVIEGYEALVRWDSPNGLVPPDSFIPLLEDIDKLHLLSKQIFEMAGAMQARVSQWISINVSPSDLDRVDFREMIAPVLACNIGGHIEVTERLQLSIKAKMELDFLREIGKEIALDDFGTGSTRLAELPRVSFLKLDKSIIDNIAVDNNAFTICAAFVGLARALKIQVIAEGIETREQADALRVMKCPYGQGYLFGKPGAMVA